MTIKNILTNFKLQRIRTFVREVAFEISKFKQESLMRMHRTHTYGGRAINEEPARTSPLGLADWWRGEMDWTSEVKQRTNNATASAFALL